MLDDMGLLRTDIEIESPLREGDRRLLHDVLVDTGAELSWAPAAVLESLGITRRKTIRFQQADGTILERWIGFAIVHAGGTFTNDEVVFGEAGVAESTAPQSSRPGLPGGAAFRLTTAAWLDC